MGQITKQPPSWQKIPWPRSGQGKRCYRVFVQKCLAAMTLPELQAVCRHYGRDAENVAETMGLLPAQIIAGPLQSEGIPARAWQESLGAVHGLTIGPLGTGYVSVPQEYAAQARAILDEEETGYLDETYPDSP